MSVRPLGREEWRTVREARLRALAESPEAFASSFAEEADRPDAWWMEGMTKLAWFVAEDDSQVVGIVAGMPVGDRTEVISMWVEPAHRGSNTAVELLSATVEWAEARGDSAICLAVASDNERARRFYERHGFVAAGAGDALRSRPEICTTEMRLEIRPVLFHIAEADAWAEAAASGLYRRSSLGRTVAQEGFIHCSYRHQVEDVANSFYRGRDRLLLLVIDPARVTAEIREETSGRDGERFPHIHGPLNLDAVTEVRPFPAGHDGRFALRD